MNKKMYLWGMLILSTLIVTSCSKSDDGLTPEDNKGGNEDITAIVTYDGTSDDFNVTGDYIAGTTLDQSHSVRVYANVTQKGKYHYETETVNGYKFVANEDFQTLGESTLYFFAQGTPENPGDNTFEFKVGDKMFSKSITVESEGAFNQENMVIIFCGTPFTSSDTYTYAINGHGEKLWHMKGWSKTFAIKNDKAYGVINDVLYSLNPLTGEVNWSVAFSLWSDVMGITIDENHLYIGNSDGLHAVNQTDGSIAWTYQSANISYSRPNSPVVTDDAVYVIDNNLVVAVTKSGTKKWEYDLGDGANGSLSIEGDIIYANSDNGVLTALNITDGQTVVWTKAVGRATNASPTVANGKVYIQGDTKFYCLDASSGNEVWSITQNPSYSNSSPVVDGDLVYINALEYGIIACNALTGAEVWHKSNYNGGKSYGTVIYNDMIIDCGTSGVGLRKAIDGSKIMVYGEYDAWSPQSAIDCQCSAIVYNTETKQAYYSSDNGNTLY